MVLSSTGSNVGALVLLSGPIGVGKSSLAKQLVANHKFIQVGTSAYLTSRARQQKLPVTRTTLQDIGDELDAATDYKWIVDEVAHPALKSLADSLRVLVDSVRKEGQVLRFREAFEHRVFHVHLTAPEDFIKDRYEARRAGTPGYVTTFHTSSQRGIRMRCLRGSSSRWLILLSMYPESIGRRLAWRS